MFHSRYRVGVRVHSEERRIKRIRNVVIAVAVKEKVMEKRKRKKRSRKK